MLVDRPTQLFRRAQTVQTHILLLARACLVAERYHRTRRTRHVTPDRRIDTTLVLVAHRQTVLERFLAVAQDILAHVTQVDIQIAVVPVRVRQRRIHQPELDILDVRLLEIRVVQSPHDTAPTLLRRGQLTAVVQLVGRHVVRTAFLRVISEVQHRQFRIHVRRLLPVRVDFLLINDTCPVVAQYVHIVADMLRRVRLRITEDRIHCEPTDRRAVLVIADLVDVFRLRKSGRGRTQEPVTRVVYVDIGRRVLEVIDIRRTYLTHIVRMTRDQVRKLRIDLEGRWCRRRDPGDLVDRVRQPLQLGLPAAVNTPDRVR